MPYSVSQDQIKRIHAQVTAMKATRHDQDVDAERVRMVRQGNIELISPDFFADDLPKSVVANIIDVAARDQAELMAPLPALACASGNMETQSDRERATRNNKIGMYYWTQSRLPIQNIKFADSINSYAFGVYMIEPNFAEKSPRIRYESSFGAYYFKDVWGTLRWFAKCKEATVGELMASYPDRDHLFRDQANRPRPLSEVEKVVVYHSTDYSCVYLPDREFEVLVAYENPIKDAFGNKRCPVVVAERPDVESVPRGQYDDVVWPALAKARMAQYMLKAADFAVNAPWAIPDDVTEINIGSDAVMRSNNPQQIRKVPLQIPQDVFALAHELDSGAKEGARYPEARTGGIQGNIITGRGVQELMGTMDTQIRTMQTVIGEALQEATVLCFYLDKALWPGEKKTIEGVLAGKPYKMSYIPGKDIQDVHNCKVTYGFAAGLSPSQAMVALLQLRADDQISRDTARRQLPFDIDPELEQSQVDAERLEDSLVQGVAALMQAMGPMVMQGQSPIPALTAAAKVVVARRKGTPIAEALLEAFKQPEPEEAPAEEQIPAPPGEAMAPAGALGEELPPGVGPDGKTQGVAHGQQGMPPGGMPDVQSLLATLRGSGPPRMEASTMVKRARG